MSTVFYKDYTTFTILGEKVNLISSETENGLMTVVEIGNYFYYLGSEPPNIESVLFAFQDLKGISLQEDVVQKIILDNKELSDNHKTFKLGKNMGKKASVKTSTKAAKPDKTSPKTTVKKSTKLGKPASKTVAKSPEKTPKKVAAKATAKPAKMVTKSGSKSAAKPKANSTKVTKEIKSTKTSRSK